MALTNPQPALEPQRTKRVAGLRAHACAQAPPSPHWECPSPQGKPEAPQHPGHRSSSLPGTQLGKARCQGLLDTQKLP